MPFLFVCALGPHPHLCLHPRSRPLRTRTVATPCEAISTILQWLHEASQCTEPLRMQLEDIEAQASKVEGTFKAVNEPLRTFFTTVNTCIKKSVDYFKKNTDYYVALHGGLKGQVRCGRWQRPNLFVCSYACITPNSRARAIVCVCVSPPPSLFIANSSTTNTR